MVIRNVDLRLSNKPGYIVLLCFFLVGTFISCMMWPPAIDDRYGHQPLANVALGFFLYLFFGVVLYGLLNVITFLLPHFLIVQGVSRMIEGSPLVKFRGMYGELFAHMPVQIDCCMDKDNYVNAICYDGEFLYVIEKNKMAALKWSDVRSWSWSVRQPDKQITTGSSPGIILNGMMQDGYANLATTARASKDSGFSITAKSLDHPHWFYNTGCVKGAEDTCRKWEEIFSRFNDGSLKIA